jgi:hypothetical protein
LTLLDGIPESIGAFHGPCNLALYASILEPFTDGLSTSHDSAGVQHNVYQRLLGVFDVAWEISGVVICAHAEREEIFVQRVGFQCDVEGVSQGRIHMLLGGLWRGGNWRRRADRGRRLVWRVEATVETTIREVSRCWLHCARGR